MPFVPSLSGLDSKPIMQHQDKGIKELEAIRIDQGEVKWQEIADHLLTIARKLSVIQLSCVSRSQKTRTIFEKIV